MNKRLNFSSQLSVLKLIELSEAYFSKNFSENPKFIKNNSIKKISNFPTEIVSGIINLF